MPTLKKILAHRTVAILSSVSLCLVVGATAWVFCALGNYGSTPLILHFDDLNGITQTGGVGMLIAIGIFGIIAVGLNSWIAFALEERDAFLGKFLAAMTLVFAALLFIGLAAIIGVN